ncbi:MAG: Flp pilus assembly protein CpaB [Herminiimonas sp.]|nr:Flp pilus assembly protein CpaB [Herminiimonas sp.]
MLIVAIVLSLLTTWLTLQYLKHKEQSIEAEVTARAQQDKGATIAVVVPTRRLPPGTLLDQSLVASRNVPADFISEDTITVEQFDALKGQALIRQVERGKPLRKADIREVYADFSGTLKPGKRAMTINVDEINSVSHMVEPGNLVDLMLVLSSSGDPARGQTPGGQTVVPFLDQVKVLATGQKVTHDDPASQGSAERRKVSYSNFTLEVTPTQAARLVLATELGKIRAVLRNENDKQTVDFDSVNTANLLDDIRERAKRAAVAKPQRDASYSPAYVEYIIGGKANGDAVAPAINVALPPGFGPAMPAADGSAAAAAAPAAAGLPDNLSQLLKLGLGNSPAAAKSSK